MQPVTGCTCGIDMPAMTHVKGRIRNLIVMPDGQRKWPLLGLYDFPEIRRFQVVQDRADHLRLHYSGQVPLAALESMRKSLGYNFTIELVEGNFRPGKYEEFICEVK